MHAHVIDRLTREHVPMTCSSNTGSTCSFLKNPCRGCCFAAPRSQQPSLGASMPLPFLPSPASIHRLIAVPKPNLRRPHCSILAAWCGARPGAADQLLSWTRSASISGGLRNRAGKAAAEGPWALDLQCTLACVQSADGEPCDLIAGGNRCWACWPRSVRALASL